MDKIIEKSAQGTSVFNRDPESGTYIQRHIHMTKKQSPEAGGFTTPSLDLSWLFAPVDCERCCRLEAALRNAKKLLRQKYELELAAEISELLGETANSNPTTIVNETES
jgi:hypothetical protein